MSSSDESESSDPLDFAMSSTSGITSENKFDGTSSSYDSDDSRSQAEQEARNKEERLETVLNILNENLIQYYADAVALQKKRDFLLLSLNILKDSELPEQLELTDCEDFKSHLATTNTRLTTVNIDIIHADSDSFLRINELIESMITLGDVNSSSGICERYLNACRNVNKTWTSEATIFVETDKNDIDSSDKLNEIDKEFSALLLGCAGEDRKNIYQRLLIIKDHLDYQILNS